MLDNAYVRACEEVGAEPSSEGEAFFHVLMTAFAIYSERSRKYGSAWRRFGALNNLVRAASKLERLLAQFWHREPVADPDFDDAYDAINYIVFFLLQGGTKQWRSDR